MACRKQGQAVLTAPLLAFALAKTPPGATVKLVNTAHALTYAAHGKPREQLRLEERPLPSPGPGEVKLRMLAAPIHPSDFGQILGNYGKLRDLPAVAGREGVGEVIEVGPMVAELSQGDRVRLPEDRGTWQSGLVVAAAGLMKIPNEVPLDMAAMAFVNPPTAWRVLRDQHLDKGAWVVQNAANSAVGLFVIQMARHLGLKTLNVVRRPELVEPLQKLGGDVVVLEDSGYEDKVEEYTGGARPGLALNSVGGESALRLIKVLGNGGTHITFGAMSFEPIRFPTRQLIFNDIRLTGFWMDRWYRQQTPERTQVMFDNLFHLMREGTITAPVAARFRLDQFAEALAAAQSPRLGKVLFTA